VLLGVPALRGQPVRQPHLGLGAGEKGRRHALNGVPSGMSAGALAVTRALQQGQVARNSSMRVVTGRIGGMSM
jgi:hypothetical protein